MKQEILVELDEDRVSVNRDTPTRYVINPLLFDGYKKNSLDPDHLKALGKSIYDSIFSTPKRRSLIENKGPDDLIIRIKSDIPKVHDIPFELLNRDPEKPEELGYLLKDPTINLLREPGHDMYWELPKRPLKMLLILAQPLEIMKEAPIDPLREVEEIRDALGALLEDGLIELFIEERPSLRRLAERLRSQSFDIVHYSGHGVKGGYLILEDSENPQRAAQQSPERFAEIFRDRPPRLIYLDTCEGARSDSISPSLAYILSKNLPHCAVVANTSSISDRAATESVKNFYKKLGAERFEDTIGNLRRKTPSEWYKTVLFALPGRRFFEKEVIEVPERSPRVEYGVSPPDTEKTYVYRYRLVRKASDLIEGKRALLLHGLGGTGKSTLAQYLCRFFGSYFDHTVFIDLKLEKIEAPEKVLEILEGPECFGLKGPPSNVKERIKRIASKGRLLLVLDNLEEVAQDKEGVLKRDWRILIDSLLDSPNVFTMLTSRFVPYRDQRNRLIGDAATLDIREYEEADISLLLHHTKGKRQERLLEIRPTLKKEFGLHPLAISIALRLRYGKDSILKILEDDELRGLLEYYKPYLSPFPLLRALCHLPVLLDKEIIKDILPAREWKLALDLGVAWEEGDFIRFYPILRHFVELDDRAREEMLERLKGKKGRRAALNRLFLAPEKDQIQYFLEAWGDGVDPVLIKELVDVDDLGNRAREIKDPEKRATTLNNLGTL
ncbi:MAG TPA: CHAT domain-containing protein, partial [Dissulfuribacter thermophilus]|nr:CHAT domain-containing protein [Dissulfuribacter thermophilus]